MIHRVPPLTDCRRRQPHPSAQSIDPSDIAYEVDHLLLHGTIVFLQSTSDYIIIAADSVTTAPDGSRFFGARKIYHLSSNVFFSGTNCTTAINSRTGAYDFNAYTTAQNVYRLGASLHEMTQFWSNQMISVLTELSTRRKPDFLDQGMVMQGIFGGNDSDGQLAVYRSEIIYNKNASPKFRHILTKERTNTGFGYGGDYSSLFAELKINQSERSKKINADVNERAKQQNLSKMRRIALIIKTYIEAVIDWSGDPAIGGEIAVAVLMRGGKLEWYHEPANHQE